MNSAYLKNKLGAYGSYAMMSHFL